MELNLVPTRSKFPGLNTTKMGVKEVKDVKDKIRLSNRASLSFNLEFKGNLGVKFDFKPALCNPFLCCYGI